MTIRTTSKQFDMINILQNLKVSFYHTEYMLISGVQSQVGHKDQCGDNNYKVLVISCLSYVSNF
jgi:hypothetical protein